MTALNSRRVCLAAQTAVMAGLGPLFGLTRMQAARSGLLLAAGGEFAFVALCALLSRKGCLSLHAWCGMRVMLLVPLICSSEHHFISPSEKARV